MRILLALAVLLPLILLGSSRNATAEEDECLDVPLGLVARIQAAMEYYDVWLQAPRAVRTYEFGLEAWFVSADVGGPEFSGNSDMAHWLVTSLDPDTAEIYKIDKGHADYLSSLPNAGEAGFDVGFLTEGLGAGQACAMAAAKETGGLGIDRKTWEERHGKTKDASDGFTTTGGAIEFRVKEGRISGITWTLNEQRPAEEARALSRDLIPDDALLSGVSAEAPRETVDQPDIYRSKWLAERFDDDGLWDGSEAGTFSVTYSLDDGGLVESFALDLGET